MRTRAFHLVSLVTLFSACGGIADQRAPTTAHAGKADGDSSSMFVASLDGMAGTFVREGTVPDGELAKLELGVAQGPAPLLFGSVGMYSASRGCPADQQCAQQTGQYMMMEVTRLGRPMLLVQDQAGGAEAYLLAPVTQDVAGNVTSVELTPVLDFNASVPTQFGAPFELTREDETSPVLVTEVESFAGLAGVFSNPTAAEGEPCAVELTRAEGGFGGFASYRLEGGVAVMSARGQYRPVLPTAGQPALLEGTAESGGTVSYVVTGLMRNVSSNVSLLRVRRLLGRGALGPELELRRVIRTPPELDEDIEHLRGLAGTYIREGAPIPGELSQLSFVAIDDYDGSYTQTVFQPCATCDCSTTTTGSYHAVPVNPAIGIAHILLHSGQPTAMPRSYMINSHERDTTDKIVRLLLVEIPAGPPSPGTLPSWFVLRRVR